MVGVSFRPHVHQERRAAGKPQGAGGHEGPLEALGFAMLENTRDGSGGIAFGMVPTQPIDEVLNPPGGSQPTERLRSRSRQSNLSTKSQGGGHRLAAGQRNQIEPKRLPIFPRSLKRETESSTRLPVCRYKQEAGRKDSIDAADLGSDTWITMEVQLDAKLYNASSWRDATDHRCMVPDGDHQRAG
jgi:hypothetical protein